MGVAELLFFFAYHQLVIVYALCRGWKNTCDHIVCVYREFHSRGIDSISKNEPSVFPQLFHNLNVKIIRDPFG